MNVPPAGGKRSGKGTSSAACMDVYIYNKLGIHVYDMYMIYSMFRFVYICMYIYIMYLYDVFRYEYDVILYIYIYIYIYVYIYIYIQSICGDVP